MARSGGFIIRGRGSVSEQFFEIDLAAVLGRADSALSQDERRYCAKLFALFFGRDAFLPDAEDAPYFSPARAR